MAPADRTTDRETLRRLLTEKAFVTAADGRVLRDRSGSHVPWLYYGGEVSLTAEGARLMASVVLERLGTFAATQLATYGLSAIPLVATCIAQGDSRYSGLIVRKETKDHGEGGNIIGSPLRGAVLIVDDVITAGTAIRESIDIIRAAGARPAGVLLALDRQERAPDSRLSAVQEVQDRYGIPVVTVVNLADLMQHISAQGLRDDVLRMQTYKERYGLAD